MFTKGTLCMIYGDSRKELNGKIIIIENKINKIAIIDKKEKEMEFYYGYIQDMGIYIVEEKKLKEIKSL